MESYSKIKLNWRFEDSAPDIYIYFFCNSRSKAGKMKIPKITN